MKRHVRTILAFAIASFLVMTVARAQPPFRPVEVDVNGFVIHDGDPQDLDGPGNFSVTFDNNAPGAAGFTVPGGQFSASGSVIPGIEFVPPHLPGTCCWFAVVLDFSNLQMTAAAPNADGFIRFRDDYSPSLFDQGGFKAIGGNFFDSGDVGDTLVYHGLFGTDPFFGDEIGPVLQFQDDSGTFISGLATGTLPGTFPYFMSGELDYHASLAGDGFSASGKIFLKDVPEPTSAAIFVMAGFALIALRVGPRQRRFFQ